MPARILDAKLVAKLAEKLRNSRPNAINEMVCHQAAKLGISSEAALILLAKKHGIGTSGYQRSLDPAKQADVRDAMLSGLTPVRLKLISGGIGNKSGVSRRQQVVSKRVALRAAIEYLIQDSELRSRCCDILLASGNFDRPVNQATLVLEERIRRKSKPPTRLVGENLVGYAFNEDITRSKLVVESRDTDDQRGFTQMLRGVVPAFRNRTHHHITNTFSRDEALRVCGFVDVLLRVVDKSMPR